MATVTSETRLCEKHEEPLRFQLNSVHIGAYSGPSSFLFLLNVTTTTTTTTTSSSSSAATLSSRSERTFLRCYHIDIGTTTKSNLSRGPPGVCLGQNNGALLANPDDSTCATFLQCNGGGSSVIKACGQGTLFDTSCSCCNFAFLVTCSGSPSTPAPPTTPAPTPAPTPEPTPAPTSAPTPAPTPGPTPRPPTGNLCPGGSSGVVPNPNDATCSTFIQCNNGVPTIINCNPGLLFNPSCSCCDWPANVDCGGGGGVTTTARPTTAPTTPSPPPTAPPASTTSSPPTVPPASRCSQTGDNANTMTYTQSVEIRATSSVTFYCGPYETV